MTTLRRRLPAIAAAVVTAGLGSAVAARVVPHSCASIGSDLEVNVSTEKAGGDDNPAKAVDRLADVYNDLERRIKVGGKYYCTRVHITSMSSGITENALAVDWTDLRYTEGERRPEVWLPSSSVWASLLELTKKGAVIAPGEVHSLAQSPLVLALPQRKAAALREHLGNGRFDWKRMLSLIDDAKNVPRSWGRDDLAKGDPKWGRFHLSKDDPMSSTSGLTAVVTAYLDLEDAYPDEASMRRQFRKLESLVSTDGYTPDATQMMRDLAHLDQEQPGWGDDTSAVVLQEGLLYQYNMHLLGGDAPTKDPRELLVPFYPSQSLVMDHPYLELSSLGGNQVRKAVADDFRTFLRTDSRAVQEFAGAGLRAPDGRPLAGLETLNGKLRDAGSGSGRPVPATITARAWPNPVQIGKIQKIWQNTRKNAHVLILMDESASMHTDNRKAQAKKALLEAVDTWTTGNDRISLWGFSAPRGDSSATISRRLMPWKPGGGSADLDNAAEELRTVHDTPLFRAIRDARVEVARQPKQVADGELVNVVIVMTDGADEYLGDKSSVAWSEGDGVPVYAIGFGPKAKDAAASLREIARNTGGKYEDAINPAAIDNAFAAMLRVA